MRDSTLIQISLGGVSLCCALRFPETAASFLDFITGHPSADPPVSLSDADWRFWEAQGQRPNPYLEYTTLTGNCSDALLAHDRCIFHAAALRFRGRAWLLCASSGVGKTTQLLTLQKLYPGEFSVICGDRPVLALEGEQGVFVYPSPWNGKEGFCGAEAAPLGGIICLVRSEENRVESISPRQAVIPVFLSLISDMETEAVIKSAARFADSLLNRVPVWLMRSRDIEPSASLLYETVFKEAASV